jgi:uncharacterized protein (TIGR04255 family)
MGSSMEPVVDAPFGPAVREVDLPRAPLVYVLAQARFERVASVSNETFIAAFQEAIRDVYPVMRKEQQAAVLLGSDGRVVPDETSNVVWRFDQEPEQLQLTLTPDAITVATNSYTGRRDLITALRDALNAAAAHLRVRYCQRLGVRYINRVTGDQLLARLPDLLRPEVLGPTHLNPGESGVELAHLLSDAVYRLLDDADFHARWGIVPPKLMLDLAVAPSDVRSWILDLDHYTTRQEAFDPAALSAKAEVMCERIYRFFRWAVTDEFLAEYGGKQ